MDNNELLTRYYLHKDYDNLKPILEVSHNPKELEILARIFLEEKNYTAAAQVYKSLDMLYEYGRCELLQGNIDKTKFIWESITDENQAILWGQSLLEFINLYVVHIPSFFQIRAFLEVDLDALLKANLITFCENIVNGAHLFAQNNQESYKFIGRVFVNNEHYELAELFLKKAKDICYVDPEVHFLLAKCFINAKNLQEAKKALNISIEKGYGYFPARKLLEKINLC